MIAPTAVTLAHFALNVTPSETIDRAVRTKTASLVDSNGLHSVNLLLSCRSKCVPDNVPPAPKEAFIKFLGTNVHPFGG